MRLFHYITIGLLITVGILEALGRTIERPAYREYKEPLISDESFSNLESYDESIAAITMLIHGECCPRDLKKALTYCLQCLQDFEEDKDLQEGVDPDKHALNVLSAYLYIEIGDIKSAKSILDSEKHKGADILVLEGDVAIQEGRFDEARKKYERAIAEDSSNLQAALRLSIFSPRELTASPREKRFTGDSLWLSAMRKNSIKWRKRVEEFSVDKPNRSLIFYPAAIAAAKMGVPSAMLFLHKIYMSGCGFIKKDVDRAEYWLWNAEFLSKDSR